MIAIGIGCRRGASAKAIVALVEEAMRELRTRVRGGAGEGDVSIWQAGDESAALFTHVGKRDEHGLHEAAAALGLPLAFLDPAVLALVAGGARSCSRRVEEMFGLPSIAETAALAGAGAGAMLLVPKLSAPTVTCAIAGPLS